MGTLETTPKRVARVYNKKWYQMLGILCITVQEIAGAEGMFSRLQHVLKATDSRRFIMTAQVHDELNLWCHFSNIWWRGQRI